MLVSVANDGLADVHGDRDQVDDDLLGHGWFPGHVMERPEHFRHQDPDRNRYTMDLGRRIDWDRHFAF